MKFRCEFCDMTVHAEQAAAHARSHERDLVQANVSALEKLDDRLRLAVLKSFCNACGAVAGRGHDRLCPERTL